MSACTARATGRHRTPWGRQKCPVCGRPPSARGGIPKGSPLRSSRTEAKRIIAQHLDDVAAGRASTGSPPPAYLAAVALLGGDGADDGRSLLDAAGNPNLPADAIEHLARHGGLGARQVIARNPSASALVIEMLADDEEVRVRRAVATRGDLPYDMSVRLAASKDEDVRMQIAGNRSIRRELLVHSMLADESASVRGAAIENPALKWEDVERIVSSPNASDRAALCWRQDCPAEVFEVLAGDPEAIVRRNVGDRPTAPAEVLERLASDTDAEVRVRVSRNPSTPASALERLAADSDRIRNAILSNPSAPASVLEVAALQRTVPAESTEVEYLIRHTNTPPSLWVGLYAACGPEARERILRHTQTLVAPLGVHRDNAPARDFLLLGSDPRTLDADSPEVMLALALHPNP